MAVSLSATGSVIARCAVSATSALAFSNQATHAQSFESGQRFEGRHIVAFLVAVCSSSAAAEIAVSLLRVIDAESLRLAAVTRSSSTAALKRHCSPVGVRSVSMVIDGRNGAENLPPQISRKSVGPAPYGDSFAPLSDAP